MAREYITFLKYLKVYMTPLLYSDNDWSYKLFYELWNNINPNLICFTVAKSNYVILGLYRASLIAQLVKNMPAMQETLFDSWAGKICWRRDRLPTPVFLGFPCGSAGKESAHNVGDMGAFLRLVRSPGEGKGHPLQYSGLENSMDHIVHGVEITSTWEWGGFLCICIQNTRGFINC